MPNLLDLALMDSELVDPATGIRALGTFVGKNGQIKTVWPIAGGDGTGGEGGSGDGSGGGSGEGGQGGTGERTFTQAELTSRATAEKQQGERAGRRSILTALGLPEDATDQQITEAKGRIDAAVARQREQESEAERKIREADEAKATSDRVTADAAADRLAARAERALVRAGLVLKDEATDDEVRLYESRLSDASKLLDLKPEASDDEIKTAVTSLKTRIPGLFDKAGTTVVTPTAPGSVPAGGTPPPAGGGASKFDAGKQRALALAGSKQDK